MSDSSSLNGTAKLIVTPPKGDKKLNDNPADPLISSISKSSMSLYALPKSTKKYDDNPALKGKQSTLPDALQKGIIKKAGGDLDEMPGGRRSMEINDEQMLKEQIRMSLRYLFEDYYQDVFDATELQRAGSALEEGQMINDVVEDILDLFAEYNNQLHDDQFYG